MDEEKPVFILHFFLQDELHDDISLKSVAATPRRHCVVTVERDATRRVAL
jgi:hypothetical protein